MSVFGNVLGVSGKGLAWMEVVFVTLPSFIPILPFLIVLYWKRSWSLSASLNSHLTECSVAESILAVLPRIPLPTPCLRNPRLILPPWQNPSKALTLSIRERPQPYKEQMTLCLDVAYRVVGKDDAVKASRPGGSQPGCVSAARNSVNGMVSYKRDLPNHLIS